MIRWKEYHETSIWLCEYETVYVKNIFIKGDYRVN